MLYTVKLCLGEEELADRMSEMRVWLDRHGFEPDLFQYCTTGPTGVLLRVDFKFEREAFAFAEAFGGSINR
jgi:hypothetical protein